MRVEVPVSFADELLKIAVPFMWNKPGFLEQGMGGQHVRAEAVKSLNRRERTDLEAQKGYRKGRDVIVMSPKEDFVKKWGPDRGPEMHRYFKRHELTHALRAQRGEVVGKPGLRGVGETLKAEVAGHYAPLKRSSKEVARVIAANAPEGVIQSSRMSYLSGNPGTLRKEILKGTVGKVLGRLGPKLLRIPA